jgi:hypothetical protein
MPSNPNTARERRNREATFPKCWCGNTAGVGQTFCGRHREPEPEPASCTDEDCALLGCAAKAEARELRDEVARLRAALAPLRPAVSVGPRRPG